MLGGVLQESFPKYFLKIHREIPVQWSLSNNVKSFQGVFKRKTPSLVLEIKPFVDTLGENRCSWIIYKIHRKAPEFESLFK